MDREYLKKHNLMEAHKQFMRLSEGYLSTSILGEDEEDGQDMEQQGPDMTQQGADQMGQPDGQMPPEGGVMPQDGGEQMPPEDGEMPGQSMDAPMDGPMDMPGGDELEPAEEDDVLDVEDLTDAQEKLNKKQDMMGHDLGEVDERIASLLSAVEKISGAIQKNNQDITDLKGEIEKRMPTRTEKLNMQSLKAYPYNVNPQDYWKDKEKEGVYQAEEDSSEPELEKEYKLTQDDVNDYTDREIEDSFNDGIRLKDIFKGF